MPMLMLTTLSLVYKDTRNVPQLPSFSTMAPSGKRIVFTGGSGKAGRHVIPELIKKGHSVLNCDLTDFPDPDAGVFTLKTDLTDR
jgi:hypothetical protein